MRYAVRVHPRAARERLALSPDGTLEAWVKAPPLEGRANQAVLRLLAATLNVSPATVTLLRGERGRHKLVELPLEPSALQEALEPRDAGGWANCRGSSPILASLQRASSSDGQEPAASSRSRGRTGCQPTDKCSSTRATRAPAAGRPGTAPGT